jgi:hypothetical protein
MQRASKPDRANSKYLMFGGKTDSAAAFIFDPDRSCGADALLGRSPAHGIWAKNSNAYGWVKAAPLTSTVARVRW